MNLFSWSFAYLILTWTWIKLELLLSLVSSKPLYICSHIIPLLKKYTKVMCLCVCVCACACVYWGNWKFSLGRNISMHDYELFLELPYKMWVLRFDSFSVGELIISLILFYSLFWHAYPWINSKTSEKMRLW